MLITDQQSINTIYTITPLSDDEELYSFEITRIKKPFFKMHYSMLRKDGERIHIGNNPVMDVPTYYAFNTAVSWAQKHLRFDEEELLELAANNNVLDAYIYFKSSLWKEKHEEVTFSHFVNNERVIF